MQKSKNNQKVTQDNEIADQEEDEEETGEEQGLQPVEEISNQTKLVAFECKYVPSHPKFLKVSKIGEHAYQNNSPSTLKIISFLRSYKPLLTRRICLALWAKHSWNGHQKFPYLLEMGKKNCTNLIRRIFDFSLKESKFDQAKFKEDYERLPRAIADRLQFNIYNSHKIIYPKFECSGQRRRNGLIPFTLVKEKMIVFGVINQRFRKIQAKGVVTIYELLGALDLYLFHRIGYCKAHRVAYSPELDMLMLYISLDVSHQATAEGRFEDSTV